MATLKKPRETEMIELQKPVESPMPGENDKKTVRKITYAGPINGSIEPEANTAITAKTLAGPAPSESKQNTSAQLDIEKGKDASLEFDDLDSIWADLEGKNAQIDLEDLDDEENIFSKTEAIPPPAKIEPAADEFTVEKLQEELSGARNEDDEDLQNFFTAFKTKAPEQEIIVGSVSVDEIQKQEQLFEEERLKRVQTEIEQYQTCQQNLLRREQVARRNILKERKKVKNMMNNANAVLLENAHKHRHLLRTYFKRAEEKLKSVIKTEQAVVHGAYGDLEKGERLNMKRWQTSWKHKPIPLEITVTKVSAVKDKLDSGVYVLLCSLFDQLGGKPMKWTKAKDMEIKPATEPVVHKGRFYDIDMTFNQKIFVISPSETKIEPSMSIVFELYRLADQKIPIDRCVGWGVMPLCDAQLRVAHGKFQLPLLCGPIDRRLDRYAKLADWYQEDLNRWLANMYFEIKHLPREVFRRNDTRPMKEFDVQLSLTGELLGLHRGKALLGQGSETKSKDGEKKHKEPPLKLGDERLYQKIELSKTVRERIKAKHGHAHRDESFDPREYRMSMQPDRMRHDKDIFRIKFLWLALWTDFGFSQLKGYSFWMGALMLVAAFFLRIYVHFGGQYLWLMASRFPVYEFELTPFHVTVKYTDSLLAMQFEVGVVLAGIILNMLVFLMGIVIESLGNMCNMRISVVSHFICFYGFMSFLDPVLIFVVDLIMGNFNCEQFAACNIDMSSPECKCVYGDAFKLPRLTEQMRGSAFIGVLITVGLYIGLMVLSGIMIYLYTMWVFMNQKIRDLYWRVHAAHDAFFMPEDLEVSMAELEWIMTRARKWIGPSNSSRKAYVCNYVLSDPLDPNFQEITSHLALYTMQIDGTRKLYRHFIKRPDGCIVEVFGDVSVHLQKEQTSIERVLRMEEGGTDDFLAS